MMNDWYEYQQLCHTDDAVCQLVLTEPNKPTIALDGTLESFIWVYVGNNEENMHTQIHMRVRDAKTTK